MEAINNRLNPVEERQEWLSIIDRWKEQYPLRYGNSAEGRIMPQHIIEKYMSLRKGKPL